MQQHAREQGPSGRFTGQERTEGPGWAERECRGPECLLLPKPGALRALNPDLLTSPAPGTGAAEVHADITRASGPNLCRGRASEAVIQTGPSRASRLSQATLSSSLFPLHRLRGACTRPPGPAALRQGTALTSDLSPDGGGGGKEEAEGKPSKTYFKEAVENKGFGAS